MLIPLELLVRLRGSQELRLLVELAPLDEPGPLAALPGMAWDIDV